MYNVLIAEDSKPIMRNIKGLLEASGLPVQIAATAANGEEALAALGDYPVDIILTDIRMPKMDGLTLIEQAKRIRPNLKAILISGYNDFEYIRKALSLQVIDYLPKPVTRGQLIEVMERVISQLQEAGSQGASLFRGIVDDSYWPDAEFPVSFYENPKVWAVIRMMPFSGDEAELTPALVFEALGQPENAWVLPSTEPRSVLLIADEAWAKSGKAPAAHLEEVRQRLLAADLPVSLGGSFEALPWNLIPEKIRAFSPRLDEHLPVFKPIVMDFGQPWLYPSPSSDWMNKLINVHTALIEQHNKERFTLMLAEQLGKWQGSNLLLNELKRFIGQLARAFSANSDAEESMKRIDAAERLFGMGSYEAFCMALIDRTEQAFQDMLMRNKKSGGELFDQIERHLSLNLYANVSIQDLASEFHISPSYISRIMKKFSGQTFVQYYTQSKINEARRLMETRPDMLIKDISDALCFSDQHYFSKVFKESVGASPIDYKTQRQK